MPAMDKYFLLLESNTTGTGRLFAKTARQLGFRPLLLSQDPSRYPYVKEDGIDVLQVDTGSFHALVDCIDDLVAADRVGGIYSSSEYWIESAALLAQRAGLPGADPQAISICRNKWKQRERLKESGLPVPEFRCIRSIEEARNAGDFPFPAVVKPTEGSGSVGVKLCRGRAEILEQVEKLLARRFNERGLPVPQQALVEEYLAGPEYSVEMFGLEVIGVTKKYLSREPYFVEIGHDFPAPLDHGVLDAIRDAAIRAVQAVGLTWGPAHVELRCTRRDPMVIEINPRLAGGFIPELVRHSMGIDLIRSTVLAAAGKKPELHAVNARYASIRFLMPESEGVLQSVRGVEALQAMDTVAQVLLYRKSGDVITRRGDFRDRLGHVITCHESPEVAVKAAKHAAETLLAETL